MAMRIFFQILFILVFLTGCSPRSISSPTIQHVPSKVTPIPTQFILGQCIDARSQTTTGAEPSLFPIVSDRDHILGKNDAYVTIMVYSDYQCASCANLAPLLKSFTQKFPNDVRIVFRNYPLISIHKKAAFSAQAAEAAARQGKFWEMHDLLFNKQAEWIKLNNVDFEKWITEQSSTLALNKNRFESDLSSPEVVTLIQKAWEDGQKIRLPGVPIILINGEIVKWQPNLFEQIEYLVRLAILPKIQFSSCPTLVIEPTKQYTATLKTSSGDIVVKLFVDKAPNTVNNFIFLAQQGFFSNNPFLSGESGGYLSSGDPSGTGLGGPGYFIPNESNSIIYDRAGIMGMLNSGPDTNGSQFFITLAPMAKFNNKYTAFGEVISGLDILQKLLGSKKSTDISLAQLENLNSVIIIAK